MLFNAGAETLPGPPIASPQTPAVDCQGCGACCLHVTLPPFRAAEIERVPDWALAELKIQRDRGDGNLGPCVWFDRQIGNCIHHEIRPQACRDFEVGEAACQMLRMNYRIGIGD